MKKNSQKFLDECAKLLNEKNITDFLNFVALHPEVSLDNDLLIFSQMDNPLSVPRYFTHSGQKDFFDSSYGPVAMIRVELSDTLNLQYKEAVLYPIKEKVDTDISLRGVFDRIGYSLQADSDLESLFIDEDNRRVFYPASWNEEIKNKELVKILVDYFWNQFFERYQQDDPFVSITQEDWIKNYRPAFIFLAYSYLGLKYNSLTKRFFLFIKDTEVLKGKKTSVRRYRLSNLWLIFNEFVQMIEGRHFTLYETDIFRVCKEHSSRSIYNSEIQVLYKDREMLEAVYFLMLQRYMGSGFEYIPLSAVHMFPPYKIDT